MRKVAYVVAVAVVVVLCWQAVAILKCKRKNAEFKRRVEAINSEFGNVFRWGRRGPMWRSFLMSMGCTITRRRPGR